jgi:hypothetical protein
LPVRDSEDPNDEFAREAPRPSLLPTLTAVFIVAASISLAVWRLFYEPIADPAEMAPIAAPTASTPRPTPPPTRVATKAAIPTAIPTPHVEPTPVRTSVPLNVLASAASRTATAAPTSVSLLPRPRNQPSNKRPEPEPASLSTVAPPRVKRGATTLLDVRGLRLNAEHRVFIARSGRAPATIAIPRQKFVNSTLLQVLVIVGADAPKGDYELRVADAEGRRSNAVHFEVTP